jgi:hypothetical protein
MYYPEYELPKFAIALSLGELITQANPKQKKENFFSFLSSTASILPLAGIGVILETTSS